MLRCATNRRVVYSAPPDFCRWIILKVESKVDIMRGGNTGRDHRKVRD